MIVQNFLPKAGTAMHNAEPCPADYLDAIALARMILPLDVHVQAPPNLSDDFGDLLDAGVSDGAVSPRHRRPCQPRAPWPDLDRLREVTEAKGHTLRPASRSTRVRLRAGAMARPALHFPVADRSDSDGYARDDAGSVWPERTMERAKVDDGAEFELTGTISSQWYVGTGADPSP